MSDEHMDRAQALLDGVLAMHNDNDQCGCRIVVDASAVVGAWVGNRTLYQIGETDLSGTDSTIGQSGLVHPFVHRVMRLLRDEGILVRVEVPE